MKNEIVGDDIIINIVNEIEKLLRKNENNRFIQNSKKHYPDKINELDEALPNYMGENGPKFLKIGFLDK